MSSISGWTLPRLGTALEAAFAPVQCYDFGIGQTPSFTYQAVSHATWHSASVWDQLNALSRLTDGWDGYGAAAIDARAIAHARSVLSCLEILPDHLLPSVSGTLLLEWEGMLGRASLEIGRDTFSFYTSPTVGYPILLGGTVRELDVGDINFALATVTGKFIPQSLEGSNWRAGFESAV